MLSTEADVIPHTTAIAVSSIDELKILSDIVNGTHTNQAQQIKSNFSGYTVILTNNLKFDIPAKGESNFIPIGNGSNNFNGIFDGQGYTISNLKVFNVQYAGLFGYLDSDATVKNLKMINSEISATSTNGIAISGGIAGNNNGTIENCYNAGLVTAEATSTNNSAYSGGIAGLNEGTITNCYNTGTVNATAFYAYSGGITGRNYQGTITNCYNIGDVTSETTSKSSYAYLGGITGHNFGTIENCYNTGIVTATANYIAYSGGIVGYNSETITNCYNAGTVTANSESNAFSGGIIGENWNGTITNCYNAGLVTADSTNNSAYSGGIAGRNHQGGAITNCYNTGAVTAEATSTNNIARSGGIAGDNYVGTITNCYNSGTVTGTENYFGEIAGENGGTITSCYHKNGSNLTGKVSVTISNCKSFNEDGNLSDGSDSLLKALNEWVTTANGQNPGDYRYWMGPLIQNEKYPVFTDWYGEAERLHEADLDNLDYIISKNDKGVYEITNEYQLALVADDLDGNYVLADDINLSGYEWRPIGKDHPNRFSGTFDGQGHTISNLSVNITSKSGNVYSGLFGYLGSNATVKNLGIINSLVSVTSTANKAYSGGIAGYNEGTITNCYNTGLVTATAKSYVYSGGIAGQNNETITNCYNTGLVTATAADSRARSGGIAGQNNETITNCYNTGLVTATAADSYANSGGIAGYNEGTITNCYNTGLVTATAADSRACSGGIAGQNNETITNCYNTGTVTATAADSYANSGGIAGQNNETITNCYNTGTVTATAADSYANSGGIAGENAETITNCYNTGTVTATVAVKYGSARSGGIAGNNTGTITNCYNTGLVTATIAVIYGFAYSGGIAGVNSDEGTITNCYNTGLVTVTAKSYVYSGGIAGENAGTITNCYNAGDVTKSSYSGGIAGHNAGTIENCYYLKGCVLNGKGGGEELDQDAMKGLKLLSGTEENSTNLNKGQDSMPWSPDIFGVNDGYPILADVPTQINPKDSTNKPPQSAVYVTLDTEKDQAENYLKPFIGTNGNEVTATVNYLINPDEDITSYQWYTMNDKGVFIEVSETSHLGTIQETYYVKVTINGYSYTSLTRTVSDTFIVMFDNDRGSGVNGSIVSKNEAITKPEDPKRLGYTFEGWYTSKEFKFKYDFNTPVTKNTTLYAKWEPIVYYINYYDGDNELTNLVPTSYTVESNITLPTASKEDYEFVGWFEKNSESEFKYVKGETMGDITLYAKWEAEAEVMVMLGNDTWDKFKGEVYLHQNGGQKYKLTGSNGVYSEDVDLGVYQIYVKMKSTDTGDPVDTNVSIDLSSGNNSAKVQYWTVTFDYNDDETKSLDVFVLDDSLVKEPTILTRIGYTFEGWYSDKELNIPYNFEDEVKSDTTLHAKWEKIPYRVIYDANGSTSGTVPNGAILKINDDINVDINDGNLAKSGHIFRGWNYTPNASSALSSPITLTKDVIEKYIGKGTTLTLYAVWTPIPEPIYTLCLNSNDLTLQTKRYSGTYGTEVTLKSASDFGWNSECKFIEWNSKSDGSGISYKEGDKFSLGSEVWNLYAIWSDSSYHTVSFDSNGGSNVPSQSIQDGYRASEPNAPTKQGHSFKYWSLNGTKYDFNQSVKEDITLKAEYEIISYKVTFYYNGDVYYSTVADYNTSLGNRMPSLPSDKDSWNTSENGKGNNFTSDSLITSDISIYAVSENSISSILIIGGSAAAILAAIAAWLFMRSRYN